MKIVVYNLGCKVNQYESDCLIRELKRRGHDVSDELGFADVYILNTCAVTNEAERKSRQAVSRALKFNPSAKVIVCGCASENDPLRFKEKSGVIYVSGVAAKSSIPDLLEGSLEECGVSVKPLPREYEDGAESEPLRTRAFLKVQDGCNNFCSYCLIPYLRGRSRSRALNSVIGEFDRLSASVKEIVLTGINLSAYGADIGLSLKNLLISLKDRNTRIRLGSLEVNVIDGEFLTACKSLKAFCPQFHLSLQSGSDAVLNAMNRHYTTAEYLKKVEMIRTHFPDAAITTDLICGFPTETEKDFLETLEFIKRVGFADMHVFVYSERAGTKAANMKPVDVSHAKARAQAVERAAKAMKTEYLEKFIGRPLEVLVEKDGGYSREYIRVYTCGADGELRTVTPTELYLDGLK